MPAGSALVAAVVAPPAPHVNGAGCALQQHSYSTSSTPTESPLASAALSASVGRVGLALAQASACQRSAAGSSLPFLWLPIEACSLLGANLDPLVTVTGTGYSPQAVAAVMPQRTVP